jgi:hypothetical protein
MKAITIAAIATLFGCASIIHGSTQDIAISTNPSGANVVVDGETLGRTPVIAHLKRGDNHMLRAELPGYVPYEMAFTKEVSGWVWGNLVFGGLIGLAVDAISGGLYYLTPEQVMGELRNGAPGAAPTAQLLPSKDGIAVLIVLSPKSGWKMIAQLQPTH